MQGVTALPDYAPGKICYIEIPAKDVSVSSEFYTKVFGWKTRTRGDGSTAFDDTVGQVSGAWVTNRPAFVGNPGMLVYIMVDDAVSTVESIIVNGGQVVQPIGVDHPEITARFKDPAGNIFGIYQQPG